MKIEIDLKVILLAILFVFTSKFEIYSIFIFFILLHELAHIIVGYIFGMKISSINMNVFGFSAQMYSYKKRKSYKKILTYLAGPISNLLFALIFYFCNIENSLKQNLVYTNLVLCFVNLIPIMPLDGGRIVKEVLKRYFGNKDASIIMIYITKIFLVVISAIYSILILKLKNIAILLLIVYMWYLYSIEERKLITLLRVYSIIEKCNV